LTSGSISENGGVDYNRELVISTRKQRLTLRPFAALRLGVILSFSQELFQAKTQSRKGSQRQTRNMESKFVDIR
jgi:hypothetical protein